MILRLLKRKLKYFLLFLLCLFTLLHFIKNFSNFNKKDSQDPLQKLDVEFEIFKDDRKPFVGFISNYEKKRIKQLNQNDSLYLLPVNKHRLNTLFQIMQTKEYSFNEIINNLGLISLNELIDKNLNTQKLNSIVYSRFAADIKKYLRIDNGKIVATENFIEDLNYLSYYYSYLHPRDTAKLAAINDVSILIFKL